MRFAAAAAVVLLAGSSAFAADEVVLQSGDTIKGKVVEKNDMHVVLDHPNLGRLDLSMDRVKSVVIEGEKPPAPPKEEPRWITRLEAGLNGSLGNTRSQGFIGGLVSDYKRPLDLWHFEMRYFRKEEVGETTQSRFYAVLRKDWLIHPDSRYSVFAEGRYDRDMFQPWDERGTIAAGIAYKFIQEERLKVGFKVGATATKEWGVSDPDRDTDVRPEALLGVEMDWKIDDTKEFTAQATYFPDLSDPPEYRILATAGIAYKLNEKGTLNLRGGAEYEYDTHTTEPFKRADIRYFLLFVMDF
jgi:putative salt-induced outer membrane protein YdiY